MANVVTTQFSGGKVFGIAGATQANPCQITTTATHNYTTGDVIYIDSIVGMTELNARSFTITSTGATTFTLDGEDSTGHTAYSSAGTTYACTDFTVSGFGTPNFAMFSGSVATTDATISADASLSMGFTDGTNQACHGFSSKDNLGTTDTGMGQSSTACLILPDSNADYQEFAFVGWITDGARIRRTDTNGNTNQSQISALLLNSDDATSVDVGLYDDLGTTTAAQTITTSAEPTFVILLFNAMTAEGRQTQLLQGLGIGVNNVGDDQACWAWGDLDASGTSVINGHVSNTYGGARAFNNSLDHNITIDNYTATTFDLTPTANAFNGQAAWAAITLASGVDVAIFDMSWPTTGNYAETNPGFTPSIGIIGSMSGPSTRDSLHSGDVGGHLLMFDDTRIAAYSFTAQDGVATTVTKSLYADSLQLLDGDGSTNSVVGTFDGFDPSGWDWTLTTNPVTNPVLGFGFAISQATSAIEITGVTYSPPTGFDYVAFSGGAIPSDSIYYINDGTATGGTTTTATTTLNLTLNEYAGLVWNNTTKAETSVIASNTAGPNSTITFVDTLTATTNGDAFQVEIDINATDQTQYETAATVSSEQYDFDYAIVDLTDDSHSATETITVTATGAEDGAGTVSLSVLGVPTFTYTASSTVGSAGLEADEIIRKKKPKDIDNQMFNTTGNFDLDNISSDGGFGIDEA